MNFKQYCLLVTGFCMVFGNPVFAIDQNDNIVVEPYALTKELTQQLTQKDSNQTDNSLLYKGIGLTITNQDHNRFSLAVNVDPKLNLWSGEFASLATGQMGTIKVIVSSVTDKNGSNIYNAEDDNSVWNEEKIELNQSQDKRFSGSRTVKFNQESDELYPTKMTGKIMLSLPININKYEIKLGSQETVQALLERDDIDTVGLNSNGITFTHPESTPEFPVTIIGFDKNNQPLKIAALGSTGVNKDNHWYNFKTGSSFDKALIFIPDEIIDIEIPFSLAIKDSRAE